MVARRGEERLFATLQWRHDTGHAVPFAPTIGQPVTTNGICRVQATGPTVDRLATVACSSGAGLSLTRLHSFSFGRWLVAMNSNLYSPQTWRLPTQYVGRSAVEMSQNGGNEVHVPQLNNTWALEANQTVVLYVV